MRLFIRIKDGQPFEHPIFEDNFVQAFPNVDLENLPEEFALFERVSMPQIGTYDFYQGVTYEWDNGIVKDVHHVRPMTDEEIAEKQQFMKDAWNNNPNSFESWVFNEEKCIFISPIPYPNDGKFYRWDESLTNWVEVTA